MNLKFKCDYKINIFYCAYFLLFVSFFMSDIVVSNGLVIQLFRYTSYLLMIVGLIKKNIKNNNIYWYFGAFVICLGISLITRDVYWCTIILVILAMAEQDMREIFKISYFTMLILTIVVVLLSIIGVIPNVENMRLGEEEIRLGLGFYHSDVLPLILFYLIVYRIILSRNNVSFKRVIIWIVSTIMAYLICGSKNGLMGTIILLIMFLIITRKKFSKSHILLFLSRFVVVFLSIGSFFIMYFQGIGDAKLYVINNYFSGRFAIAYHAMTSIGVHLVNFMNGDKYTETISQWFVIDNGYLYVMLRYGILFIIFYYVIHWAITKKYKDNYYIIIVSIAVAFTNFVDNDLFSYNFLPILLLAFNSNIEDTIKLPFEGGSKNKND